MAIIASNIVVQNFPSRKKNHNTSEMADPTKVATGLADLAVKVKDKADQAESNQATCKILVSIDPEI